MALLPLTQSFLRYLHTHPQVRSAIKASADRTLLYSGFIPAPAVLTPVFSKPMWQELQDLQVDRGQQCTSRCGRNHERGCSRPRSADDDR